MKVQAIKRSLLTAVFLATGLLVSACGGGGSTSSSSTPTKPTEGADASYAVTDKTFDYKSVKSVSFSDVLSKMSTAAVLPTGISDTKGYVTIYVGTSDDRTQLAYLTVALDKELTSGRTSTENMGIEIPLGTTQVNYEIYGEDANGNEVTPSSGSVTL